MTLPQVNDVGLISDERGPTIVTATGIEFHLLDPTIDEICIEDVAHSLGNICRFAGHTRKFYSVAQHSLIVSEIVSGDHALWGLLHDAAEAYMGDITRPLKRALDALAGGLLTEVEDNLMAAVIKRFNLSIPVPREAIKVADNIALATEKRDLMPVSSATWADLPNPLPSKIVPLNSYEARMKFLWRYEYLTGERVT